MTGEADTGAGPFGAAYASAFEAYLIERDETRLRAAYELGRDAVTRRLTVLDLAVAHHEALQSAFVEGADSMEMRSLVRAGGEFFLESLSAFEMVQRGFAEAREAALLERRQTDLARRLSTFLADGSLALDGSSSLEEMLQLVAEQARELVDAGCCVATVGFKTQARAVQAASYPDTEPHWAAFTRWLDLSPVYATIRSRGGSVRMSGDELARLPAFQSASGSPLRAWLGVSLTTLDGGGLGAIQLFDKASGVFTREDEAAVVHLAQMASAAIERVRLYGDASDPERGAT